MRRTPEERFEDKFTPEPNTGCWLWSASISGVGYGHFWTGTRAIDAHRYAWERANGPIPAGMFVCHHCDNRMCVNPDHLFLGTPADNARDMVRKGRARPEAGLRAALLAGKQGQPGSLNGRSKLNEADVAAIRAAHSRGESQGALSRRYGVSRSLLYVIVKRLNWRHVA